MLEFYDEDGRLNWSKLLFYAGVAFMAIGLMWMSIDGLSIRHLERSITDNFTLEEQESSRVGKARDKWRQNYLLFADHWSAGLEQLLALAEHNTGEDGAVKDLHSAQDALEQNQRGLAGQYLYDAENKISQASDVADTILGDGYTLGLYDRLHQNQTQADGTIATAQSCITTNWSLIRAYESSDNYALGVNDLVLAQSSLDKAVTANTTVIERGLVDKPLAYDHAVASNATCNRAITDAQPTPPTPTPAPTQEEDDDPIIIIIDNSTTEEENETTTTTEWWGSDTDTVETDPYVPEYEPPEPWDEPSYEVPDTDSWEPDYEPVDTESWDDTEW
jgi:hypothetical protein